MANGEYKLVYVAPERLTFSLRSLVQNIDCPLVAIEEAHCISEWGHDFRPEYMRIGEFIQDVPQAAILACTATLRHLFEMRFSPVWVSGLIRRSLLRVLRDRTWP